MEKARLTLVQPSGPSPSGARVVSAKTQPPRQGQRILVRKRLAAMVAQLLEQGSLWINGPPGAGKTVLAAHYGVQADLPVAWYEFDALDGDIVSFFSTFPLAFSTCIADLTGLDRLPELRPEDMLALPVFGRRFFRTLFFMLPEKWLLILDNFQEIPKASPLAELMAICLQELPIQRRTIVLSRKPPPPCFARMKVEGSLQQLEPDSLLFTPEEISGVITLHGIIGEQENCIQYLQATTAGWAAGLTLLLKEQNLETCSHRQDDDLDHQELFDYFAGVIFTGLDDSEKNRLMTASLLPEIRPAVLDVLLGEKGNCHYFLSLSRENFFTYQLDSRGELFQFHPLFREFLRQKAGTAMGDANRTHLLEQAAAYYEKEGNPAEAVELFIRAGSWQYGMDLIRKHGAAMVEEGRFGTLLRWQQMLPAELVARDPWLLFFFGNATTAFNPVRAMKILEKSFSLFQQRNNTKGALLACCSLTNSIINHLSDLTALDPWLDFLEEQLDPRTFANDGTFAGDTIASAVARAFVLRRPDHPDLELWLAHVVKRGGMHPALITHYLWTGRFPEARAALDNIYAHQENIGSKLLLSAIKAMEVQYYLIMGEPEKCIRVIDESLRMMEETGIRVWEVHFFILGAGCCLNSGRKKEAAHYLQLLEDNIDRARLLERSYYHVVKTLEALLADDPVAADRHQRSALDMAKTIGMPSYSTWCWYGSALVAVFQDDVHEAQKRFAEVFRLAASPGNPWFTCLAHFGLAWLHLRTDNREEAIDQLRQGFALAKKHNYLHFFFFIPKMMEAITIAALEEEIEVDFVRSCIRRWNLVPARPPVHLDTWPWPVRIFTLGRFSIARNDKALSNKALARVRPIQLLQAIIALGGRQVRKTKLADIFWPDANGDEQMAALKTTLHRLRDLLQIKNAVLQTPTDLTINPRLCWIDAWQFERLANRALSNATLNRQKKKTARRLALAIYRNDFIPALDDEIWTFSYREHLQGLQQAILSQAKTAKNEPE